MIFRRRRLWFVALIVLVLAGGAAFWRASTQALWVESGKGIFKDMPMSEVVALLGRPPDFTRYPQSGTRYSARWDAMDGEIYVVLENDQVYFWGIEDYGIVEAHIQRFAAKILK